MPLSWMFTSRSVGRQCAALPLRRAPGHRPTVGLVTSRDTGRWVLPKGWSKPGLPPHVTAAEEAREEAGLVGKIASISIGTYAYRKRLHVLASVICEVDVFVLEVTRQLEHWPEQTQRKVAFFSPEEAAGLVAEAELARLLRSLPFTVP